MVGNRPVIFCALKKTAGLSFCCSLALMIAPTVRAASDGEITAVSSRVSDDYVRTKLQDKSFPAETYAFGQGGYWAGPAQDDTIDNLKFIDVAHTIAGPLARQNYLPATNPNQTKLLIMVYWGTTTGIGAASSSVAYQNAQASNRSGTPNEQESAMLMIALENRRRDQANLKNAQMLGYDSEGLIGTDYGRQMLTTARHLKVEDLTGEIEDNRYFVVLMAYDFQLLRKEKKHKLLWETRFSIRENRNDFGKTLSEMAQYASRYFGQDSHGLIRKPIEHVDLGELKILGVEPEKQPSKAKN